MLPERISRVFYSFTQRRFCPESGSAGDSQCELCSPDTPSTYARQRISNKHIEHPHAPNISVQEDHSRRLSLDSADDHSLMPEWVGTQSCQRKLCLLRGNDGQEFALIGDCQRIQTKNLACPPHPRAYRDSVLIKPDGHLRA